MYMYILVFPDFPKYFPNAKCQFSVETLRIKTCTKKVYRFT